LIAFKITRAKAGWGISRTDKAGSDKPEGERGALYSYISALQQMSNTAEK
jgi:hypothetical protein